MTFTDDIMKSLNDRYPETGKTLYNLSVFQYDYATGRTTETNYFRNPFRANQRWSGATVIPHHVDQFFPSLTPATAFYA